MSTRVVFAVNLVGSCKIEVVRPTWSMCGSVIRHQLNRSHSRVDAYLFHHASTQHTLASTLACGSRVWHQLNMCCKGLARKATTTIGTKRATRGNTTHKDTNEATPQCPRGYWHRIGIGNLCHHLMFKASQLC